VCDDPSGFVGQIPPACLKAPGFEELREPVLGCVHVQTMLMCGDTKSVPVFGSGSGCSGVSTRTQRRISPARTQLCTARGPAVVPDVLSNGAALAARLEVFVPMIWLYRLFTQNNVFRACGSCVPGGRRKLELYSFRLLVDGLEVEVVPRGFCMQNEF
jgi:hypothetical protein